MPLVGVFTKIYETKKFTIFVSIGFIASNLLCYFSTSIESLTVARIIMGLFSGLIAPAPYLFIKQFIDPKEQSDFQLRFSAIAVLAPVIGACFITLLNQENVFMIFILNGAICLLGCYLIFITSHEESGRNKVISESVNVAETLKVILFCISIGAIVALLESGPKFGWFNSDSFTYISVACLFTLFLSIFIQAISPKKVLAWDLFIKFDTSIVLVSGFFIGILVYGLLYFVPYYLSVAHNASPSEIFQVLMYTSATQVLMLPLMIYMKRNFKPSFMMAIGSTISLTSVALMINTGTHFIGPSLIPSQVVRAVGVPMTVMSLSIMMLSVAPKGKDADLSSFYTLCRGLGGALGVALLSAYASFRKEAHYNAINSHQNNADMNLADTMSWHFAFSDTFFLLSVSLSVLTFLLWVLYIKQSLSKK